MGAGAPPRARVSIRAVLRRAPLGAAQRLGRRLCEGPPVVVGKMPEVVKPAGQSDAGDGYAWVAAAEHVARMLQPHLLDESHRRVTATLTKGSKKTAGADANSRGQFLDGNGSVPVCRNVFLGEPHLPGCRGLRVAVQEVAVVVTATEQKGNQNQLFELGQHKPTCLNIRGTELRDQEQDHA